MGRAGIVTIRKRGIRAGAAVLATFALAAVTQAEPRALTLDEAVALAKRNAPGVVQAQGQTRTRAAGVRAAYASFLPNVNLTAGATRQLPSGGATRVENGQVITLPSQPWSSSIGLGASVEVFDGGRRLFDIRQARALATAAEVNESAQLFNAALAAKQSYFDVLAARESQAAAAAQLGQAELQRKTSIARARARVATRSDSLRAEIQVRSARLAVMDADNALATANAALTRATGSTEPVTAATADSLPPPALALDDAALAALLTAAPTVRQAEAERSAAHAASSASWTDYLPSLTASYSRSGSGTGGSPTLRSDDFDYAGSLRMSLSFPLFNQWQREQQATQARVAERNAEAALRDTRLAAEESLTRLLGTFRSSAERVASLQATVEAAEEDLRVQQQRYAAGGSTLLDVLSSQTQLDQARRDLIRARYDQRVAKAQLEALVGRDL